MLAIGPSNGEKNQPPRRRAVSAGVRVPKHCSIT